MKNAKRTLALLLALVMSLSLLAGCGDQNGNTSGGNTASDTPLVVGYAPFSSKFSPFFSETAYDQDVWLMTQLGLLTSDRTGAIIYKGIEGETIDYNGTDYTYYGPADLEVTENADGTVYYDFTLRDDLKFSDGEPLTIDDVIFSMYVLCDPTYEGNSTLYAQPIEGMEAYRSGMSARQELILAAGPDGYTANDYYTEDQYNTFWAAFNAAGVKFAQEILDYLVAAGANAETDSVAAKAANWGFTLADDATVEDFWAAIVEKYGYDLSDDGINAEKASSSISELLTAELGDRAGEFSAGVQTGESAANISGIQKTGDYSMRIVMTKVDAVAIYQLGVTIAPMHYYGDKSLYDYDNNSFGFPKGDLSSVRAKTTQPMGAGPYKFVKFENGTVYFEANESYFQGAPKTKYVNFKECISDDDKLNGVTTGTIDITDPSMSSDTAEAIADTNSNGELTGYKVTTDVAIDSYYGERASVINYPISDTSWAAPRPSDDGYKVAFSTDVEGNDIYTSDMSAEDKYAAAKTAALGYLEAAGYTVADGKVTAAPEGAKMEYEVWIPADGKGDHPSFMILTLAKDALAEIGMTLTIKDLTNSADLWTALEAQQVAMWAAAWGATVDPDMYQIYYSDVADAGSATSGQNPLGGSKQGGSNYMYCIADPELDQLIMDARATTDQTYRKAMYKACLDIVIDWAVEIPVYQRQNCIIFSSERVNMDTVTPDITTFYGWLSEVQNVELAK